MSLTRIRTAILLGLLMVMSLCYAGVAYATVTEDDGKRIYDEAGLLTSSEYDELEAKCLATGEDANVEIFILIHNDSNSEYPERYIENFEDQMPAADRVYFLYDLYRGEIFIEGYGTAETYIHSKRIDTIFDNVEDDLRAGNYVDAFSTYIDMSASYMKDDSDINTDHDYSYDSTSGNSSDSSYDYNQYYDEPASQDSFLTSIWFQLIAALALGGIVVGAMAYNAGGRMTVHGNDYLDPNHSGLIGRRDLYLRTTVTRVRKPENNNGGRGGFNAGGFRGGISMGGRSHSSGGRKL